MLKQLGLEHYQERFEEEELDFDTFLTMTESDLKEIGVNTLGARRKIQIAISGINVYSKYTYMYMYNDIFSPDRQEQKKKLVDCLLKLLSNLSPFTELKKVRNKTQPRPAPGVMSARGSLSLGRGLRLQNPPAMGNFDRGGSLKLRPGGRFSISQSGRF